jgi:hypothetical protein
MGVILDSSILIAGERRRDSVWRSWTLTTWEGATGFYLCNLTSDF